MMKFNFDVEGKIRSFGLVCTDHSKDREIERARVCSFDKIGQTIRRGLPTVVRVATENKKRSNKDQKDLILINESLGHSVVLKIQIKNNCFVMIVKTVIDEARNLWVSKKHSEISEVVRV